MNNFNFADRYAEAGISPSGSIIAAREGPAKRIADDIATDRLFDLIGIYYGTPNLRLDWFVDEFRKEDQAFSLVNNERESIILAAGILGSLVTAGNAYAILGLHTSSMVGMRKPSNAGWLIKDAEAALLTWAVKNREWPEVRSKIVASSAAKLKDEIAGLAQNDWAALVTVLGKIRVEGQGAATSVASQTSDVITALVEQNANSREQLQILWWLVGEYSRNLNRPFSTISQESVAIVAGLELGELSTASILGPVAAPAILGKILRLALKERDSTRDFSETLDGLGQDDLEALGVRRVDQPPRIFPVMTALNKAQENPGAWKLPFERAIGLKPDFHFLPLDLAKQVYYEQLLGQLL